MTTVWLTPLSAISQACYDKSYALLSAEEHQRLQRIQSEKKQGRVFIKAAHYYAMHSARFLNRHLNFGNLNSHPIILRYCLIQVQSNHQLEPHRQLLGVAIGNSPLGLDIESIRINRDLDAITKRVFTPQQSALIAAAAEPHKQAHFLALWNP